MTHSELVQAIAESIPRLLERDINAAVGTFFDEITSHLASGGQDELRGFGSFSTQARKPRVGRNPRTGESVEVRATRATHFASGKDMRLNLNS